MNFGRRFVFLSRPATRRVSTLFSTFCFLALFLEPNVVSAALVGLVFLVSTFAVVRGNVDLFAFLGLLDDKNYDKASSTELFGARQVQAAAFGATFLEILGVYRATISWVSTDCVAAAANATGLSKIAFVVGFVALAAVLGSVAAFRFSNWIVAQVSTFAQRKYPNADRSFFLANLRRNFFFPLSASAFFSAEITQCRVADYLVGIVVATVAAFGVSAFVPSFWKYAQTATVRIRLLSAATAAGVCLFAQTNLDARWEDFFSPFLFETLPALKSSKSTLDSAVWGGSVALAVGGFAFAYLGLVFFWKRLALAFRGTTLFQDATRCEISVYVVLFLGACAFATINFWRSTAFCGTGETIAESVLYTSDSQTLSKYNAFLSLPNADNDVRQPLFAAFSTPFTGAPYLIARLVGAPFFVQILSMNFAQIALLFLANFAVARAARWSSFRRVCFMSLVCCCYATPLFVLMIEQYVVAYFWAALAFYLSCEKKRLDFFIFCGAGGTLSTSLIFAPLTSEFSKSNAPSSFFRRLKEGATVSFVSVLKFALVATALGRIDALLNAGSRLTFLRSFTENDSGFCDNIAQYFTFVCGYFRAPSAEIVAIRDHFGWTQTPVLSVSVAGVVIFLVAALGALANRKKRSSLLAGAWIAFSFVLLGIVGWGTSENGLILYSLYFGWAFLFLALQLVEQIEAKLRAPFLFPTLCAAFAIALFVANIPELQKTLAFAATYYPR